MNPYLRTIGLTPGEQEVLDSLRYIDESSTSLVQCECGEWVDTLEDVMGKHLCATCAPLLREEIREVNVWNALAQDDTDMLLTAKLVFADYYARLDDKSNCENLLRWNMRLEEALKGKNNGTK